MQKDIIRLDVVGDLGTKVTVARRLQQRGWQRLDRPSKFADAVLANTRSVARVRHQTPSLAALEAENVSLRCRVVELALQIQALGDRAH